METSSSDFESTEQNLGTYLKFSQWDKVFLCLQKYTKLVNTRYDSGSGDSYSSIFFAVRSDNYEVALRLFNDFGAELEGVSQQGKPLITFAKQGSKVEQLINQRLKTRREAISKKSEYHNAIYYGDWNRCFIELQKDRSLINNQTSSYTAIQQAAWHGAPNDVIQKLVDMGADLQLPTVKSGENAYDIAKRKNHVKTAEFLKQLKDEKYSFIDLDIEKLSASNLVKKNQIDEITEFIIKPPPSGDVSYTAKLFREISNAFHRLIPNEDKVFLKLVKVYHSPNVFDRFKKHLQKLEEQKPYNNSEWSPWEKVILSSLLKVRF